MMLALYVILIAQIGDIRNLESGIQNSWSAFQIPSSEVQIPKPVEIVVFSDFQCPYCALFANPLREVQTNGVDGVPVHVTFKHFPLPFHANAPLAHQAALAAAEQGRFWEMHDLLFANQQRAQREDLAGYAEQLGLDMERFQRDLDSDRLKQIVEADKLAAKQLRVSGTPAFYVNGRAFSGYSTLDELKRIVLAADGHSRTVAQVSDASMSLGPASAPVTLEVFADFGSPLSVRALDVMKNVLSSRPSDVRIQFRHFPLVFHPQAALAHEAAVAAAAKERFWAFADYLMMDHPTPPSDRDLSELAGRIGLDPTSFAQALHDHRYKARVGADLQSGREKGVRGSPTILVNGRRLDGLPTLETLNEYVDDALAARHQTAQPRKP